MTSSSVVLHRDDKVPFPAYFVKSKNKTDMRSFVAHHARLWLELQKERKVQGCVVFDIDDTLIDGHQCVANGFPFMVELYNEASLAFPVHIVTARPDDQHEYVMRMLREKNICLPTDRLHMLPEALYNKSYEHVEKFKWGVHEALVKVHGGVIARFGDRLWDVAHLKSVHTYLRHVEDRDCYIFFDPALNGTLSSKLPG